MQRALGADELATLAQSTRARVAELEHAGLIRPGPDGYAVGDVHRIRLAEAFVEAGVAIEALANATEQGAISFAYYDQLHEDPGPVAERSYDALLTKLGPARASGLRRLQNALGLAEPEPGDRLAVADEAMLLEILATIETNRDYELALRAIQILGTSARRTSEAAMSVYGEAVDRATEDIAGIPPEAVYLEFLRPWARIARLAPRLAGWLQARHLSSAIDSWSVAETERLLAASGYVPARRMDDPAIAFVDLTGFTRLTEEQGDRTAARVAGGLADIASRVADARRGRLVKQLGDGVLLRFASAHDAVDGTLDLLDELDRSDLPPGHAGVESGPLIVRDGDVFGATVNRAARIADVAEAGQLLATADLARTLPAGGVRSIPVGAVRLQGIAGEVRLVRLVRHLGP